MKLWDLRMMKNKFDPLCPIPHCPPWDYRWMEYPLEESYHPDDCSIKTFRGHKIQRTLIRCFFSPLDNFVYTGSADGKVHIFGINDDSVHVIRSGGLVRDLCWHPYDPSLLIAPWGSNMSTGYLQIYEPTF
jgi:WD repeat-containing protein 23